MLMLMKKKSKAEIRIARQRAVAVRWVKHPWAPPAPESELRRLYHEGGHTQKEIAEILGCSQKVVWRAMKNLGIEQRSTAKRNQWGALNPRWKGEKASYSAKHYRVERLRGQPRKCEVCGTTTAKIFEWANLSGLYDDPNDYKRMCGSCHKRHDKIIRNITNAHRP